jgi:DnaJ homolog subfamily A member 5
MDREEE